MLRFHIYIHSCIHMQEFASVPATRTVAISLSPSVRVRFLNGSFGFCRVAGCMHGRARAFAGLFTGRDGAWTSSAGRVGAFVGHFSGRRTGCCACVARTPDWAEVGLLQALGGGEPDTPHPAALSMLRASCTAVLRLYNRRAQLLMQCTGCVVSAGPAGRPYHDNGDSGLPDVACDTVRL